MTGGERAGWDAARRALYLLRPGVPSPLSADRMVWPSLFDFAGAPEAPAWTGANALLWDDLDGLRRFVAGRWPPPVPSHAVVALSWVSDRGFADAGTTGPYREPTTPATMSSAWTLLGFDVGDGSLLSGLMNCGYAADEVDALRARWAARLNEHHLFSSIEDALAFREVTDARVPEHAPFFVYGLYVVTGALPANSSQNRPPNATDVSTSSSSR